MVRKKKEEILDVQEVVEIPSEESVLSPAQYFDILKGKREQMTEEKLGQIYENAMTLMKRYKITGQKLAMKKLTFYIDKIEKEKKLLDLGFKDYIYKDAIEDYIDNVAEGVVKIIELENYERDLPDSVVDIIEAVQNEKIFSNLYVIFTDYTGRVERKVKAHRREKDPILVGGFMNRDSMGVSDRLYLLADWVDPFCDLTLEKMLAEMKSSGKSAPLHTIEIPEEIEKMKKELGSIRESNGVYINGTIDTFEGSWTSSEGSNYFMDRTEDVIRNE